MNNVESRTLDDSWTLTSVEGFQPTESMTGTLDYMEAPTDHSGGVVNLSHRAPNRASRDALQQMREGELNTYENVDQMREAIL